jgi:hypothetical protein
MERVHHYSTIQRHAGARKKLLSIPVNQIIFNKKSIINLLNLNGCTNHGQCDGKKLRLKEANERGKKSL